MSTLRFHLLGAFEIQYGGLALPTPPTLKSQSLLAYLICHRDRPQRRDKLVGLFWAGRPERKARRSLATALWHIRRRCLPGDEFLLSDVHAAQFNPQADLWLDVDEFTALAARADVDSLQSAVTLYRGDFLDGFYDDWVINERYRLQNCYLDTLARLMRLYETAVRPQQSLQTALTLLQHDPLREDAHRAAIRAYAQLGRRSDALRQFDQCRQLLAEELGVEPSPETAALRRAILDGKLVPVSSEQYSVSSEQYSVSSVQSPSLPISHLPLTEREAALAELAAAWAEARRGNGRLLFVQGEAGIGKSRLLAEFSAAVRQSGGQVLSGACYEFERRLPYQPLADALRPALARLCPAGRAALPGWLRAELRRLLPGWEPDAPPPPTTHPDTLFHAVARFLAQLGQAAPVLLLLDDLHWANEATLALLHYLARHGRTAPLLILCAHRETAPPPLADLRQSLARARLAQTVTLARLSAAGVRALVRRLLPQTETAGPLADFLFTETEGNPFFLAEMLKSLEENGVLTRQDGRWRADLARLAAVPLPGSVKTAVARRLGRLSPEARKLAGVAAVLGRACQYELLRAVWPADEEAMLAGLDDLLRAHLLQEEDEWDYAFTHHKIQEAIYDDLPRHRRLHWHAQAGRALLAQEDAQPAQLAHHLAQGAKLDKSLALPAAEALCRAGEQAAAQFAYADALAYFRQALALEPETAARRKILLAREAVYHAQGAREAQARDLEELAALPAAGAEMGNEIRLRHARFAEVTADFETAVSLIQQILAAGTPIQRARAHILQGDVARKQGDYAAAVAAIQRALPLVAGQPAIHAQARLSLGTAYLGLKQFEAAAREHQRGRDIYRRLGDRRGEAYALNNLAAVFLEQGRAEEAAPVFAEARAAFREIGDRRGEGLASANLGMIGMRQGDYETARRELEYAGEIFVAVGDESSAAHLWLVLGMASSKQMALAAARRFTQQALAAAARLNARNTLAQGLNNLGYVAALSGRFREAEDFYRQSLAVKEEIGDEAGACTTLLNLAQAYRGLGEAEEALARGRAALEIACRLERGADTAGSLCEIGFALLDLARAAEATAVFTEALPLAGEKRAYALAGLAAAALAQGEAATAVAHVAPILPALADAGLDAPEMFAIFEIGCRALAAAGKVDEARKWRETAVSLLEAYAANVEDEALRRAFLQDVPVHRRLREA